jgi:hypothetical protein
MDSGVTAPPRKPTLPEMLPLLGAYYACPGNDNGGDLHIITEDGNIADQHVRWCAEHGRTPIGRALGELLLRMSLTQRKKIAEMTFYSWRSGVADRTPDESLEAEVRVLLSASDPA